MNVLDGNDAPARCHCLNVSVGAERAAAGHDDIEGPCIGILAPFRALQGLVEPVAEEASEEVQAEVGPLGLRAGGQGSFPFKTSMDRTGSPAWSTSLLGARAPDRKKGKIQG
jgi:hypothetical protein